MKIVEVVIGEDGDLKIPEEVRNTLGVEPSGTVRFVLDGRSVRIEAARSTLRAGYGAISPRTRPEDFAEIRRAMEEEMGDTVARDAMSQ